MLLLKVINSITIYAGIWKNIYQLSAESNYLWGPKEPN